MDYNLFIRKIVEQDKRNILHRCDRIIEDNFPKGVLDFYKNIDIVDVEIVLKDLCSIKLYNLDEIRKIQNDYDINEDYFVFATKEGDPILIKSNAVFLGVHGVDEESLTFMYNSLYEFLEDTLLNLKV